VSAATFTRLGILATCFAAAVPAMAQETRSYDLGHFDRIEVSGVARIDLSQGDRDAITVTGDRADVRGAQLEVVGGELRVNSGDSWKFWNRDPLVVSVQMRELKRIGISGASEVRAPRTIKADQLSVSISGEGMVRLEDLRADTLRFDISGAGDGDVGGQVGDLRLSISGKGKLLAERLRAARASLSISGIGNADVWATDSLKVNGSGIGTVNYWGQPLVQRTSAGMATINARGDKR
jgi:hypothetical protein